VLIELAMAYILSMLEEVKMDPEELEEDEIYD